MPADRVKSKEDLQAEFDRLEALVQARETDGAQNLGMEDRSIGSIAFQELVRQRDEGAWELATYDSNGWGGTSVEYRHTEYYRRS